MHSLFTVQVYIFVLLLYVLSPKNNITLKPFGFFYEAAKAYREFCKFDF